MKIIRQLNLRHRLLILLIAISLCFTLSACDLNTSTPAIGTTASTQTETSVVTTASEEATTSSSETTVEPVTTTPATTTTKATVAQTTKVVTTKATTTTKVTTAPAQTTQPATTTAAISPSIVQNLDIYNLNSIQLQAYSQVVAGIQNCTSPIVLTCNITVSDFENIFKIIKNTQHEYTQIPNGYSFSYSKATNYIKSIEIAYLYPFEQSQAAVTTLQNKVSQIVSGITPQMTEFERIKYLHDTIIKNCEYKESGYNSWTAYGALVDGQAVCEGYSKAMALLCDEIGIQNVLISGPAGGVDHMWNMIMYNGNWYHMDLTWDDPVGGFGANFVRYDYFNLTTQQIKIDHAIDADNCFSIPSATAIEGNYFVKTGGYANSYDEAVSILKKQLISAANAKIKNVSIKLANQSLYNDTFDRLFSNSEIQSIVQYANASVSNQITGTSYMTKDLSPSQNIITIMLIY